MSRPDISLTAAQVARLLREQRTGVLASNGRNGFPHQVAMWYLPEPERILMWTYRKAQKAVNLRRDPRASFLVETGSSSYGDLRGVRIEGRAEFLEDPEEVLEIGLRLERRNATSDGAALDPASIRRQAPKRVVLALPLQSVSSWDHRRLSGHAE